MVGSAGGAVARPTSAGSASSSGAASGDGASTGGEDTGLSKAPPPLLHVLLPLVEAFFLAHATEKPPPTPYATRLPAATSGGVTADSATASIEQRSESKEQMAAAADHFSAPRTPVVCFGERHRRALNALVRQSPSLLTGGFAPLVESVPWALEFDNKRHYLRQRLRALRGDLRYDAVRLHVRRSEVFMDSYHQLRMPVAMRCEES